MCVCQNDDAKYEVIVSDLENFPICTIYFKSISLVCRFLDDFDFTHGRVDVYRKKDMAFLESSLLMSIWKGYENEVQNKRIFDQGK